MGIYAFFVTDSGAPKTGLTPTWSTLKRLSDNVTQTLPTITEVGGGWYKYTASIPYLEHWVGTIDAGATQNVAERYIPVDMIHEDFEGRNKYCHITPVYAPSTDSLNFITFLLEDGRIKTTDITSVTLTIYDTTNVVQFTLTTTSFSGGIATLTKSTPNLTVNKQYYVIASFVTTLGTITGSATFCVLQ